MLQTYICIRMCVRKVKVEKSVCWAFFYFLIRKSQGIWEVVLDKARKRALSVIRNNNL